MLKTLFIFGVLLAFAGCAPQSSWLLIDDFEGEDALLHWTNVDVQNETQPHIDNPQVTEIRSDINTGNQYLIKKPAADGIVGNRKAMSFRPLPVPIEVGETYTVYSRFNVEYFPNNHSFGLSNLNAADIPAQNYNAFEPMLRITDKAESNGIKNDGTLMVSSGHKAYHVITNPETANPAEPLRPDVWYEVWWVVNNAAAEEGGQTFDLYMRGGEFTEQSLVHENAVFRMNREAPLTYFTAICNIGPKKAPYGNGGVRYDDLYMAPGRALISPF